MPSQIQKGGRLDLAGLGLFLRERLVGIAEIDYELKIRSCRKCYSDELEQPCPRSSDNVIFLT